jgi:alpha-tubulin suppressor-like RCC1 family protein
MTDSPIPVDAVGLSSGVSFIAMGTDNGCALMTSGGVKCWGYNHSGQVGNGTTVSPPSPVDVTGLASDVSSIAHTHGHACALTKSGGVKCWGNNLYGSLGNGTVTNSLVPVDVFGLTSGVSSIALGGESACAVTTSGGVKCWGANAAGQLGNGTTQDSSTPIDVFGLSSGVSSVTLGYSRACALTKLAGVKCWGWNSHGELGNGTTTNSSIPVDVVITKP